MWIKSGITKSPCHVIQKVARAVPPLRNGAAGASVRAPKGAHKKARPKLKPRKRAGLVLGPVVRAFAAARPGYLCLFFLCVARRGACFSLCASGCARRAPPPAQFNVAVAPPGAPAYLVGPGWFKKGGGAGASSRRGTKPSALSL